MHLMNYSILYIKYFFLLSGWACKFKSKTFWNYRGKQKTTWGVKNQYTSRNSWREHWSRKIWGIKMSPIIWMIRICICLIKSWPLTKRIIRYHIICTYFSIHVYVFVLTINSKKKNNFRVTINGYGYFTFLSGGIIFLKSVCYMS